MTNLAPIENDVDLLLSTYKDQEVPKANTQQVAQLYVYIAGKRFTDKGANLGFVIDHGNDQVEVDIKSLRLSKIDGPIGRRIMWPYSTDDGTRLQNQSDDDKLPWCASNDGISPKSDYIGKEYTDWRTKEKVTIVANGCKSCPLGDDLKWAGLYDFDGNAILRPDFKGVPQHVTGAPPCAHTPLYVFFDHDRGIPLVFIASNTTHRRQTLGRRKWKGNPQINGVPYFTDGDPPKVYDPKTKLVTPLVLTTIKVDNKPYGFLAAPQFDLSPKPLTPEEQTQFLDSVRLYHQDKWRDIVTGARFEQQETVDPNAVVEGATPF